LDTGLWEMDASCILEFGNGHGLRPLGILDFRNGALLKWIGKFLPISIGFGQKLNRTILVIIIHQYQNQSFQFRF